MLPNVICRVSEERFWRNYFYRVSLVRQSALDGSAASPAVLAYSKDMSHEKNFLPVIQKDGVDETSVGEDSESISQGAGEVRAERIEDIQGIVGSATQGS